MKFSQCEIPKVETGILFNFSEIMKSMEDFKDLKMLKMKIKPSEFLEVFIEDLKRTYFESLKMKGKICNDSVCEYFDCTLAQRGGRNSFDISVTVSSK